MTQNQGFQQQNYQQLLTKMLLSLPAMEEGTPETVKQVAIPIENEELLMRLLDILDLFDEVEVAVDKQEQLRDILRKIGIEEIHVIGEPFSSETMHSLGTVIDHQNSKKQGHVCAVLKKGYRFIHNEQLIRHALVKTIV